jgi:DNA-binding transcriptional LysR family regulator
MLDRVTGMQVFIRVATLEGFTAAAKSLNMPPMLVSKHVSALEERFGVKLLYRTTRKVTLTEAGRQFLDGAERILADIEGLEAFTSADRFDVRGTLRVNAPQSFGVLQIAPLMHEFSTLYSSLKVDLGLNDRVVDLIEEGWDVAVRIGVLRDSSLIARKLANCQMVVCASPAYLDAYGIPSKVEELSQHQCLGYTLSRALGYQSWSFGANGDIVVPIKCTLRANNGDALVAAAISDHGFTYQPTFMVAEALRSGALVPVSLDHPPIEIHGVYAVYPSNRRPPAKVRAFNDFLAAQFGAIPPWDRDMPEFLTKN